MAKKIVTHLNNLQAIHPKLAEEWHPAKNGELTPREVTPGSNKKVWWKCAKDHEWVANVKNRNNGRGCPYCSNKKVHNDNCLAVALPKLAKEWHPDKNGDFTPQDVTFGSHKKAWWICKRGHAWEAVVASRSSGRGCPYCNSQTSMEELRIYAELKCIFPDTKLRQKINKVECDIYIPSLKVGIEYDGKYWHKNKHKEDSSKNMQLEKSGIKLIRVRESGLDKISENDIPYDCRKQNEKQLIDRLLKKIESLSVFPSLEQRSVEGYLKKSELANNEEFINLLDMLPSPFPGSSLADQKPELVKEWHPVKNGALTPWDVTLGSNKKVWWKCKKNHDWQTTITHRSSGTGCPYCSGRRAHDNNCLQTLAPLLAKEWHSTKNGNLTAKDVALQSNKKVWWQCRQAHEWQATVSDRSSGTGCPYCKGNKVNKDNCLATLNPKLSAEWHLTNNGGLTPNDVTLGSSKMVWWKCSKGHEWQATIANRTQAKGCPYCSGRRACKDNCLSTVKPLLAEEWHGTKNNDLTPQDVTLGCNKKVWWKCKFGHEWQAIVASRRNGVRCPHCHRSRKSKKVISHN